MMRVLWILLPLKIQQFTTSRLAKDVAISSPLKKNSVKIARTRQRQIHHFLNNYFMRTERKLSVSEVKNTGEYEVVDYQWVVDILNKIDQKTPVLFYDESGDDKNMEESKFWQDYLRGVKKWIFFNIKIIDWRIPHLKIRAVSVKTESNLANVLPEDPIFDVNPIINWVKTNFAKVLSRISDSTGRTKAIRLSSQWIMNPNSWKNE